MKLLSLHGGGMLGYGTLCYLEQLEIYTKKTVPELFDMIGGDSTGAIIAGGYAAGLSTKQMITLYEEMHSKIFGNKRNIFMALFYPFYKVEDLESSLKSYFKDIKISDAPTKTLIYAVELDNGKYIRTKFWKSWKDDELLYKICTASGSAPAAFKPYKIGEFHYTDGGIASNNPSMCLVAEALRLGAKSEDIEVVSMWTQQPNSYGKEASKLQGLIKVMLHMSNLFTACGEDIVDYQVEKVVKTLVSIKPKVNLPIDNKEFSKMKKAALDEWESTYPKVVSVVK